MHLNLPRNQSTQLQQQLQLPPPQQQQQLPPQLLYIHPQAITPIPQHSPHMTTMMTTLVELA